jgi:hypothetical protein
MVEGRAHARKCYEVSLYLWHEDRSVGFCYPKEGNR